MTLRVRGKQWYWVYKIDINNFNFVSTNNNVYYVIGNSVKNNYISEGNIISLKNSNRIVSSKFPGNSKPILADYKNMYSLIDIDDLKSNKYLISKDIHKNQKFLIKERVNVIKEYKGTEPRKIHLLVDGPNFHGLRTKTSNSFMDMHKLYKNLRENYPAYFQKKIYKKMQSPKYYILIQKSMENWVKEGTKNYNNYLNYKNFYNYNSYNNARLLRVNKILVLPTDVFINVITNSFDVVHSWFIPGLGFKMDCVPGRSTHHTLYIDIPGIYYGQCAEICGRLHHHMPIRVCSMLFEHFFAWYVHFFFTFKFVNFLNKNTNKLN